MKYKGMSLETRYLFSFNTGVCWSRFNMASTTEINTWFGYSEIGEITKEHFDDVNFDFEYWLMRQLTIGVFNSKKVWKGEQLS